MLARRRWPWAVAILVVAVLGGAVEGFLPHTDDGCPTEIHCVACKTFHGGTALAVRPATLTRAPAPPEPVPAGSRPRIATGIRRTALSRGPPAAA